MTASKPRLSPSRSSNRRRFASLWAGLLFAAAAAAAAGPPFPVADLAPGTVERSPFLNLSADAGGQVLFRADDGRRGVELWRTDGTPAGTRLYAEACPGLCAEPAGVGAAVYDGEAAYFTADNGIHGRELWRSDGTIDGTSQVIDLCPGPCSPRLLDLALVHGQLYFRADLGSGPEPWTSDGRAAGTRPLGRLRLHPAPGAVFLPLGGEVAFQASGDEHGNEWWASDGTPEGTRRLTDLCPGSCSIEAREPTPLGDVLLFAASVTAGTESLYRLEPSGAAERLIDLCDGDCDNALAFLHRAGDRVYVSRGQALWSSDGTAAGTVRLFELPAGVRRVTRVAELGDGTRLLTAALDGGRNALWRLEDGGLAGPLLTLPGRLLVAPRETDAILIGRDDGVELWRSDGTTAGTVRIDRLPHLPNGFPSDLSSGDPRVLDGRVLFAAFTGADFRDELWVTDGRAGGAERLVGAVEVPASSDPGGFTPLGDRILFSATAAGSPRRDLVASDGTAAGTEVLAADVDPESLTRVALASGERVFFSALTGRGSEPWLSDGTVAGTRLLAEIGPGTDPARAREPVVFEGSLVFLADRGWGQKIWRSDGTEAGTEVLVDVNPDWLNGPQGSESLRPPNPIYPRHLRVLDADAGSRLVFVARDDRGAELWASDGTAAGTDLVADLQPGALGSRPDRLTVVGGRLLFFTAAEGARRALWVWRGPRTAPVRLRAVGEVVATIDAGGRLVWLESGPEGTRLGVSDGSVAGTGSIELPGAAAPQLAALGRRIYFTVADEAGAEPWTSDLTAAGTGRLSDLWPGPHGSHPQELRVAAGRLYFSADDGESGRELWRYDPSLPGPPERLSDLAPGAGPSSPRGFARAGGLLYFSADDGESGRETWAIRLEGPRDCARDAAAAWGGAELRRRCWGHRAARP